jgi:hypothetical protein
VGPRNPRRRLALVTALLVPTSLTADLDFPDWNYFERGQVRLSPMSAR